MRNDTKVCSSLTQLGCCHASFCRRILVDIWHSWCWYERGDWEAASSPLLLLPFLVLKKFFSNSWALQRRESHAYLSFFKESILIKTYPLALLFLVFTLTKGTAAAFSCHMLAILVTWMFNVKALLLVASTALFERQNPPSFFFYLNFWNWLLAAGWEQTFHRSLLLWFETLEIRAAAWLPEFSWRCLCWLDWNIYLFVL